MEKMDAENGNNKKAWMLIFIFATIFLAGVAITIFLFMRDATEDGEASFVIPSTVEAAATLGEEYTIFKHPALGFSVEYPNELIIERYDEGGGGETLVFRQQEAHELLTEKVGFQIYTVPFGEEVISRERILKDLPDKAILELQTVTVNPDAEAPVQGLLFWSESPEIGKTREVWFAREGFLYAITTYAHLDLWLAKILSTWRLE